MVAAEALTELTDKQRFWFMHYTDESNRTTFLNATQSALAAYNTEDKNSARQIGMETKRALAPHLDKWFDEEMFSEKALKDKVRKLMGAGETKFIKIKGAVDKAKLLPGQRVVCASGSTLNKGTEDEVFVTEETLVAVDQDAKETQRRSTDMAIKIKGMYAPDNLNITGLEGLAGRLATAKKRTSEGEDDDLFS